jgi:hypothetical protein
MLLLYHFNCVAPVMHLDACQLQASCKSCKSSSPTVDCPLVSEEKKTPQTALVYSYWSILNHVVDYEKILNNYTKWRCPRLWPLAENMGSLWHHVFIIRLALHAAEKM